MCKHGTSVPMPIDGRVRDIDSCMALLVATLNTIPALETVACCCGHGNGPGNVVLKDGRELFIAPDFNTARKWDELFQHNQAKELTEQIREADVLPCEPWPRT